jgi:hypothetical protein
MKLKLITLAEFFQEWIKLWEKYKVACASLAVGSGEPRQPTVTGAHSQLSAAWSKRPALSCTLRSWHNDWVTNSALLPSTAKGKQPGMTW